MKPSTRLLLGLFGALLLVGSCVDGESPMTPDDLVTVVQLPVYASFNASAADAAAQPINRIRAVAERLPDGAILGSSVQDVSPTAESWEVSLDVSVTGPGLQVVVFLELIHVDAAGNETVEFSGRAGPIPVSAGGTSSAAEVEVVRGPTDNLNVVGIEISQAPETLFEGQLGALEANVSTNAPVNPTVFWTVLEPEILDVVGTQVRGLVPGVGRVVATAGAYSDTANVRVLPRPASVVIEEDTIEVPGVGAQVEYTGHVLDPRGDPIPDAELLWRSLDPALAESLGDGVFRALALGEGLIEARSADDESLTATAVFRVRGVAVDVAVEKTVSAPTAQEGDTIEFTVTVRNVGTGPAFGATVTDDLPVGLSYVSSEVTTGAFDPVTGTWALTSLVPQTGAATLVMRVAVARGTAGRTLVNEAVIALSPDQTDVNPSNDRATAEVMISELTSDLAVTKLVDKKAVQEGDTVTFDVIVANLGPADAPDVQVSDRLPSGFTYLEKTPDVGTYDELTGIWSLSLPPGVSRAFRVRGVANRTAVGEPQVNTATARHVTGPADPFSDNNRAAVTVEIQSAGPRADVSVSKTVDLSIPQEGELVTFSLEVANAGPDAATNILLSDVLPAGLTFDSEQLSGGVTALGGGQYSVAGLDVDEIELLSISAFVDAGTTGQTITNAFQVVSLDQFDPDPENNTALVQIFVGSGPLNVGVTKSADQSTITEGGTVTFTMTVENFGPGEATGVILWDSIPEPLVFVSATATAGTYDETTHMWDVGTMAAPVDPDIIETLTIVASAPDGSGGTSPYNEIFIYSLDQPDLDYYDDLAGVTVTVQARQLDVGIVKSVDNPVPVELDPVAFTLEVVNYGPGVATNIEVLDTLTAPLQVDGYEMSHGSVVGDSLWLIPSLPEGDTARLVVYMTVEVDAAGSVIRNLARIQSVDQTDTNGDNDQSLVQITIPLDNPPTVMIEAPADGAVYDPGDPVTFAGTASDVEDGDLTASIDWYSDQDGLIGTGTGFTLSTLSPGPHVISAEVTDQAGTTVTDQIGIVIAIVTTPTTLNVPFGGTASLPISLSAPAPTGGLDLTVTSADPSITDPVQASLTIPEGALSANAVMQGLTPGTTDVTVASVGYGSSTTSVSVTAEFDIIQGTLSIPQGFPQPITIQLESQGTPIAAPAGGVLATLTAVDPGCVAAPASVTIPAGLVSQTATLAYGGSATLSCVTYVRVTAPGIAPDSVRVTVAPPPTITLGGTTVGSGLQYGAFQAFLGTTLHAGVTVRIESLDSETLLVSPDEFTAGTPFIDVFVPAGQNRARYHVHGGDGITSATATLQASAPGFTSGTTDVNVVQPGVDIINLVASTTTFTADDPFSARIGVPYSPPTSMWIEQALSVGSSPVTATLVSSDPAVGDLTTTAQSGGTVTVDIVAGAARSPSSVAAGGVAFNPATAGATDVSVTIPGYLTTTTGGTRTVNVSAPTISVGGTTVGSGLQYGNFQAILGATAHGGVTVRIQSSNPQVLLVAPDASTEGSEFIDVMVADGQNRANYYVQGVEGVTSASATLTVTALGFSDGSATVNVVQPGVDLINLVTTITTLTPDDPFQARIGVPYSPPTSMWIEQAIRPGGTEVTATFGTSDPAVGDLVTTDGPADQVSLIIPVLSARTASSVAAGGVAFNPISAGAADVSVTVPGFLSTTTGGTRTVTVTAPTISVTGTTVGAGLQYGNFQAILGATAHGGVTVRIESSDPQTLLVAPDALTEGSAFIDVPVADGQNRANYYVQGVEGASGVVPLNVSAPGFTGSSADITVVQPAVDVILLSTTHTTFSADDPFGARVGVPYSPPTSMWLEQSIRIGGTPATARFTSSNTGVGVLKTSLGSGGTASAQITPGSARTPGSVGAGGVSFDPLGSGTTDVSVIATGYVPTTSGGTRTVTVSSPGITLSSTTVGAGLQYGNFQAILGATAHGGVTVRIESSAPGTMLVSPDATTEGAAFIDVVVPDGQNRANYYVHGVEGASGTATLLVSAPGFTDGTAAITVTQPAFDIIFLGTTTTAGAVDDPFQIRTGVPYSPPTGIWIEQAIRFGASPVTATITSSDPGFGQLVTTAFTGRSVTVDVVAGQARSPSTVAAGGVAFDPLAVGSTTVSASIAGFIATNPAVQVVTINP